MEVITGKKEHIKIAAKALKEGKLVAFPTDTVYGLGASIKSERAIDKLYDIKGRPKSSAIIALIGDYSQLNSLVEISDDKEKMVKALTDKFWPGALTLILNKKKEVTGSISGGTHTIGVRMPNNDIARSLIIESGDAVATPSANKTGQISPTSAEHVLRGFAHGEIEILIDGGKTKHAIESTILSLSEDKPIILRSGMISKKEIEDLIGEVDELKEKKKSEVKNSFNLRLIDKSKVFMINKNDAIICLSKKELDIIGDNVYELSENSDIEQASQIFFETLHKVVNLGYDNIYCVKFPNEDLGYVLNERIKKMEKTGGEI